MNKIRKFPNFDNKKILFFAETHFQVINCINIAVNMQNCKCDLYINELYNNSADLANRIKKLNIFHKTRLYNVRVNKVIKMFNFLSLKNFIYKMFNTFDYDIIFFASRDFLVRSVITYCKYINKLTLLVSYDEGLGTYSSKMECYTNHIEKFIIRAKYHDEANIVTDKMLYKPEIYIGKSNNITLFQMPTISKRVLEMVNYLYKYNNQKEIDGKYIYFDGYYNGQNKLVQDVIRHLTKKTNGKLIIKKHPQTPNGIYTDGIEYKYSNLPYEVIAANDANIQNKILITSISTSVWTPMMLFNKYPKIILLYPLFNEIISNAIIEKLVHLYSKNEICIIKNFSELENLQLD